MITAELEYFTVEQAVNEGLYEAIKRGETKFSGYYECGKDGVVRFTQQNFVFTDKNESLRAGKFADNDDMEKFIHYIKTGAIKDVV